MSENIEVRGMRKGDIKSLARLDEVCFAVPWSEQAFSDEAENELATYLVAYDGDKVIGYIGYWKVIDEGHITNIAVLPEYRRKGIASKLLDGIVKTAKENGLCLLTLEVRKSNMPARCLYEGFGFEALGERKDYYKKPIENAVIMTLMLGEN